MLRITILAISILLVGIFTPRAAAGEDDPGSQLSALHGALRSAVNAIGSEPPVGALSVQTHECGFGSITLNVTLSDDLNAFGCVLTDGQYVNFYRFTAQAGVPLTITYTSSAFRLFSAIQRYPDGVVVASGSTQATGTLTYSYTPPITQDFTVAASTLDPYRSGFFTLRVSTSTVGSGGGCVASSTTLCLNGGRFQVRTQWTTREGQNGAGQAIPLTSDTGYFWFFSSNNVEMVIKVVDGRAVNSRFWVFAGGLTNVNVVITVTDTQTGNVKTYTNPQGAAFQPIQDTGAFASTSEGNLESSGYPIAQAGEGTSAGLLGLVGVQAGLERLDTSFRALAPYAGAACIANATTLCLNGGRFQIRTQWTTREGQNGAGQAVPLTSDTGYFWFFSSNNVEMVTKVVDGQAVNSRFWVFAGGLTNVAVVMTVTDTQTGAVRTYSNPQAVAFAPIQDTAAFASSSLSLTGTFVGMAQLGLWGRMSLTLTQVGNSLSGYGRTVFDQYGNDSPVHVSGTVNGGTVTLDVRDNAGGCPMNYYFTVTAATNDMLAGTYARSGWCDRRFLEGSFYVNRQ